MLKNILSFFIFKVKIINPIIKRKTFWGDNILMVGPRPYSLYFFGYLGKDEIYVTDYIINNLKKGDIFIDIGANVGFFSLLSSKIIGETGRVYSFEPYVYIYEILKQNTAPYKNIDIYNEAILNTSGTTLMTVFPNKNHFYNTLVDRKDLVDNFIDLKNSPFKEIEVHTTNLDDFCEKNKISPKIIKIDTEGSDIDILMGLEKTIKHCKPTLLFEVLPFLFETKFNKLIYKFKNLEYSCYQMVNFKLKKIESYREIEKENYNFVLIHNSK